MGCTQILALEVPKVKEESRNTMLRDFCLRLDTIPLLSSAEFFSYGKESEKTGFLNLRTLELDLASHSTFYIIFLLFSVIVNQ